MGYDDINSEIRIEESNGNYWYARVDRRMCDNIDGYLCQYDMISDGPYGTIQVADGHGMFRGEPMTFYADVTNINATWGGGNVGIGTMSPGSKLEIASGGGISFGGQYKTYQNNYSINDVTFATLLDDKGDEFHVNKSYRVRAVVVDAGRQTGATAIFRGDGGTFTLVKTFEAGKDLNHVEFFLDAGIPKARLYNDATQHTVSILVEESQNRGYAFGPETNLYGDGAGNIGIGINGGLMPQAQLHTTGSVRFAGLGAGTVQTDAQGNLSVSADMRLKDKQNDFNKGLEALRGIQPIAYKWNSETGYDTENSYYGFSAQNVQLSIPEAVGIDSNGYLTLSDRPILATTINAIKEQDKAIMSLQTAFNTQLTTMSKLFPTKLNDDTSEIGESVLEIQEDVNKQANLMESIEEKVNKMKKTVENDLADIEELQTSLVDLLIVLDEDNLLYTSKKGDLTIDGILKASEVNVNKVVTDELVTNRLQLTNGGKSSIIGKSKIEKGKVKVVIATEAVESDSVIFVTPKNTSVQSLSVGKINCDSDNKNCTGFTVEVLEPIEDDVEFNWMIVEGSKEN